MNKIRLDADIFDLFPWWWRWQANVSYSDLIVYRKTGGTMEEYVDGGYGYVCTRRDLSGQEFTNK